MSVEFDDEFGMMETLVGRSVMWWQTFDQVNEEIVIWWFVHQMNLIKYDINDMFSLIGPFVMHMDACGCEIDWSNKRMSCKSKLRICENK